MTETETEKAEAVKTTDAADTVEAAESVPKAAPKFAALNAGWMEPRFGKGRYWKIFLLGFAMYLACVVPFIIYHGGIFFYYGDYNVQQVPFYILAHRAARSGHFFWSQYIDLGGSMGGSFAFYLWGSPFFWLTVPFPEAMIPYMMPFLMAAKFGTAMMTSFAWIRTQTKTDRAALIGAVLYAFSGFQACNIVFQHFHEVTAFFPLYLIAFDVFIQKKKRLPFALMTAFMAILNYYFFVGEIVFFILYFIIRYALEQNWKKSIRQILELMAFGLIGIGLSLFFLVQSLGGVMGNDRLDNWINGMDVVAYPDRTTPLAIIKSIFTVPDLIARGTLFSSDTIRNGSLSCYLPMFALTGVVAYFMIRPRKNWKKRILTAFLIMAFVPVLNSLFSALNSAYYARWFYLPILIMAAMTAEALEEAGDRPLRKGFAVTVSGLLFVLLCECIPVVDGDTVSWFSLADNVNQFWVQIIATSLTVPALVYVVFFAGKKRSRKDSSASDRCSRTGIPVLILTVLCCIGCTVAVLYNGTCLIARSGGVKWQHQMLESKPELPDTETFSRVETDSTSTNYEMVWGYSTIHCFESTVTPSIFKIFDGIGMRRTVESTLPFSRIGMRQILSLRYYLENDLVKSDESYSKEGGLPGYTQLPDDENAGYHIYENDHFIPMGFTFDSYLTESDYDSLDKNDKADRLLVKDLILSDGDAEKYGQLLTKDDAVDQAQMTLGDFYEESEKRAASACTDFAFGNSKFTASASLPKENLVFFSVPYDRGWTAYVDGVKTEILCADYGMMAVDVPAGDHQIEFRWQPFGFKPAAAISLFCAVWCLLYWYLRRRLERARARAALHSA
jgi:uncharacterized membrane protein YfhO